MRRDCESRRALHGRVLVALGLAWLFFGSGSVSAVTTTTLTDTKGTWTIKTGLTDPREIQMEYQANRANTNCTDVGIIQSLKIYKNGTLVTTLSDLTAAWAYRDNDVAADGTFVDHLFCFKDPAVTSASNGYPGASAGASTAGMPAKLTDLPTAPNGFKFEFEACAVCRAGTDSGMVYGCFRWTFENTAADGTNGSSTVQTPGPAPEAQSQAQKDAVTKFEESHGTHPNQVCAEEVTGGTVTGVCLNKFNDKKGPLVFHLNDNYKVKSVDSGVKTGSSSPDVALPANPVSASSTFQACDYIYVPKDKRIELERNSDLEGPDPQVPFSATFVDFTTSQPNPEVPETEVETVETGACLAAEHCGVRVQDCFGDTFAAAAPQDTSSPTDPRLPDPDALILYNVIVDPFEGVVIFRNDPLSSGNLLTYDVRGGGPFVPNVLLPGGQISYFYPEGLDGCSIPDAIVSLFGSPDGGDVQIVIEGQLIAVPTAGGQSLADVMTALANQINSNPNLAALGITATSFENRLLLFGTGLPDEVSISDPGLSESPSTPGSIPPTMALGKHPGGLVSVAWEPSCALEAVDYAIYEGAIGNWGDHGAVTCTDSASNLMENLLPAPGDRYFLIVPLGSSGIDLDQEGSYGTDSGGAERPAGVPACVDTQVTGDCPPSQAAADASATIPPPSTPRAGPGDGRQAIHGPYPYCGT